MDRITITLDGDLLEWIDAVCKNRGYTSRSEAFRDIVRTEMAGHSAAAAEDESDAEQICYGTLTYVYDHESRDLPGRLTTNHHHHHGLSVATTHVHINEHECLEVSILRGKASDMRAFADSVISQRGVRHGSLAVTPMVHFGHDVGYRHGHEH